MPSFKPISIGLDITPKEWTELFALVDAAAEMEYDPISQAAFDSLKEKLAAINERLEFVGKANKS